MNNKKLLLGLTVLATPFVVENLVETNVASANTTYNLTESVQVYGTAQNASKQANSTRTYDKGTYYVYKQHNGMINISKTPGKAGAWINPATGKVVETATTKAPQPTVTTTVQTTKSVPQSTKQTDTSKQQTQQATNLSLAKPKEGQYSILKTTDAYVNAIDASKKVNAKGKVSAGNYYVFREYKGMLNVSRAQGKVGSWINPSATTIAAAEKASTQITSQLQTKQPTVQTNTTVQNTANTTKAQEQKTGYITSNGRYTVTSPTAAYTNAIDASKKANERGKVAAGVYYIFREYRGMLNVSRAQGKAGSWINPGIVEKPQTTTPPKREETKQNTTTQTTKPTTTSSVINKTTGTFTLTSSTDVYVNAIDASKKVNARGKAAAGSYHIFREYKGMLNISKAQGKPGSWINPGSSVVESKETKPKTETTTQKDTKVTNTSEKTVGQKSNGMFVVTKSTEAYISSADASKKINAKGTVVAGTYHIFREHNGMLNISKEKGKVGSWINPNGKTVETTATSKLPETAAATKEVSGAGVKYYTQDKAPWSSKWYGLGNMHHTGCVPTSLAMAISTLKQNVSPDTIANYLYKNTNAFNKKVQGTAADGIAKVLNHYGLKYKVVNTKTGLNTELGKGNMVLSLVQGAQFITPGYTHAVIAKGLDKLGRTTVYNPYSTYGIKKFSTDTLYKAQSQDKDDRKLGGTFISIFK